MRFIYTVLIILVVTAFISWLNYWLLSRLFVIYRARIVRYAYLFFTVTTILVIGYGWSRRPPFVVPEHEVYHFLVYSALGWLFGQLILLILQPLIYVAHRMFKENRTADTPERLDTSSSTLPMTRREFLHGTLAATPLLAFGISTKGIYEAQTDMIVQRYSLVIPHLPPNLKGFKIGQVSDTHLGPYFDLARLDRVITLLAKENPDLVVITGDFADDLNLLKPAIDRFNDWQPSIPYEIYFCFGNHDYFQNIDLVRSELHKSRIIALENENSLIIPGQQPFYLMGVDYPWSDSSYNGINVSASKRQQCFMAASQNVPLNAFKVLIAHHPDSLIDGFDAHIPLTLAGHTHGGQVVIGGKPLLSSYAYMRGLYQEKGAYGYVSSGAGQWFPFRLGCPPEISVFTLQN
jgi:predicted MPP superfamily phosphohydrolase